MRRNIIWTAQFKKDYKKMMKRHFDMSSIDNVIRKLANGEELPKANRDHSLSGN